MKTVERWISRISILFASLIVLAMMLQVVIDVAMRKFLGAGFPATADIVSRYYMVSVSFLPLAMTEVGRRHISATIFTDALRGPARSAVQFLGIGLSLAAFALLLYGTTLEALKQTAKGAYVEAGILNVPTWPSYWILPVSFTLMEIMLLLRFVEFLRGVYRDDPHDPLEEVDSPLSEAK
ncbi:TRAP transporter small permease [Pseudooceanicola nanhaiensis]|uniref:TRAP transporter small permease n=1 Tax=Pseudooceanicola nanhaiensis TaxID=375761 RepID=UPI001CD74593|nr:TRAP transporter small permease [Pseudooceanicola nanhaiensis]MCA0922581.1 TRAP transporter small permease [Pseudooceanicola nanhaiensis]